MSVPSILLHVQCVVMSYWGVSVLWWKMSTNYTLTGNYGDYILFRHCLEKQRIICHISVMYLTIPTYYLYLMYMANKNPIMENPEAALKHKNRNTSLLVHYLSGSLICIDNSKKVPLISSLLMSSFILMLPSWWLMVNAPPVVKRCTLNTEWQ